MMSILASSFSRDFNSFSGVDIKATFAGRRIGELQGISYTVTREKAPVYTMGSPNPRSFSRGKRGIAGSLIFVVLNRSNLLESLDDRANFWAGPTDRSWGRSWSADGQMPSDNPTQQGGRTEPARFSPLGKEDFTVKWMPAWYHDQIPPFNIVLTAMTEYGVAARMAIIGVEILNAGSGISIDDITTDENMTFVARDIMPWRFLGATPLNPASHSFGSYHTEASIIGA
jgi:hypothetical protein